MDSLRKPYIEAKPVPPRGQFSLGEGASFERAPIERLKAKAFPRSSKRPFRPLMWISIVFLALLLGSVGFFLFAGMTLTQSIHFENRELSFFDSLREVGKSFFQKTEALQGEKDGRINILLLGRAGESYPGRNLTDTVMVMSIDTGKKRVALLSFPRDLFVPIVGAGTSTKVNALYQYGLSGNVGTDLVEESIQYITGLPIHYHAIVDFDGFEKIVDALGGIKVEVPRDFYDTRYPGKNYSYETFELKAGWQKLDGATALKYARERHNDPEGDFGRAKRQQQILQAMREKAFSLPTFLNPFTLYSFLQNLGESITTDIAPDEIRRFIELSQTLDTRNVHTVVIDAWKKESLLRVDHLDTPSGRAFLLVPRSGTWDEIRDLALHIFDRERDLALREKITTEQSTVTILTAPSSAPAARALENSLRNEFPLEKVSLRILPALENTPETAMIEDRTNLSKPFSLDALLHRYALEKTASLPYGVNDTGRETNDFVILFTKKNFIDTVITETDLEPEKYDFQEPLPPQPKK